MYKDQDHATFDQQKLEKQREEREVIDALRKGNESSFILLVDRYHNSLLRIAILYVHDHALAEEIVQETWMSVLKGVKGFEGRSSLKTWIFKILNNIARTRWERENRSIPFSMLDDPEISGDEPSVDSERFLPSDHPDRPGGWAIPPKAWNLAPEEHLLAQEIKVCIQKTIDALPHNQQMVITMRDIEGWTSEEVCNVFQLSETNQRVLLHRARSKVRRALEKYFEGGTTDAI